MVEETVVKEMKSKLWKQVNLEEIVCGNEDGELGGEIVTTESTEGRGKDEVEVTESSQCSKEAIDATGGTNRDGVMVWDI